MSSTPQISVVIPTYDRPDALEFVLAGLAAQKFDQPFEVIVIQDGQNPQTSKLLQSIRTPFELNSASQPNAGPSAARNHGVRFARAPIIVFLDDDIVPSPELLNAHFAGHQAAQRSAIVGCTRLHPDSPFLFLGEATDWSETHLRRCSVPGYQVVPQDVPGGNFSVRRDDLEGAGGWNEQMVGGGEDRELAVRLVNSGVRLTFAADALGEHYYCKDWARHLRDMYLAGSAGIRFYQSHPERLHDIPSAKWLAAGDTRRSLFRAVRFVPDVLFRFALAMIAPLLRRVKPRRFRRAAGAAARLTGLIWYARGFWNQGEQASAFARAVESTMPVVRKNLISATASNREK